MVDQVLNFLIRSAAVKKHNCHTHKTKKTDEDGLGHDGYLNAEECDIVR